MDSDESTSNARAKAEEVAAVWVPRASLKPWAENPRRNDDNVKRVADSIKRFGFSAPIVARKADGEVIAGHTRLKAAELLGLEQVPVRYLDLDPADAHLLALADNRLTELSPWDDAALHDVLSGYGLEDADLAGWSSEDLAKLAQEVDPIFAETGEDEQGKLDRLQPRIVTCPECGHTWDMQDG